MKKLIIAGGSGFIGKNISKHFKDKGYNVIVLTRGKSNSKNGIQYLQWDAKTFGSWTNELEGADLVINLTGKSVDCRYTEANKKEILASELILQKLSEKRFHNAAPLQNYGLTQVQQQYIATHWIKR